MLIEALHVHCIPNTLVVKVSGSQKIVTNVRSLCSRKSALDLVYIDDSTIPDVAILLDSVSAF